MERAWTIQGNKDGAILLSVRNADAPTCFLPKEPEGIWHGRWLVDDRMRVQLAAQDTFAELLCGDAPAARSLA